MLGSHVATFQRGSKSTSRRSDLTSRCSREGQNQHRDVSESVKIIVAMLGSHVATFQRGSKSTSRRSDLTSQCSRECKNQRRDVGISRRDVGISRRDVGISRRDVPERFKLTSRRLDVATFQHRDVTEKA